MSMSETSLHEMIDANAAAYTRIERILQEAWSGGPYSGAAIALVVGAINTVGPLHDPNCVAPHMLDAADTHARRIGHTRSLSEPGMQVFAAYLAAVWVQQRLTEELEPGTYFEDGLHRSFAELVTGVWEEPDDDGNRTRYVRACQAVRRASKDRAEELQQSGLTKAVEAATRYGCGSFRGTMLIRR
ncbi:hypothetical protein ACIO6T_39205 [Streptomyces sp. NPDC087532]|uniref:hypothetical protein n=1 Tax=Streptomyces sp. NPDC087532 TaxID=3365795 RepID=UPI00381E6380